ncbi:hypothetical protein N9N03_01170 [Chlamydiia bacterium]|nr:hypothetical protein [Chlamydiia bacterium]
MNTKWLLSAVTLASAAYAMDMSGICIKGQFGMAGVGVDSENSLTIFDANEGTLTTGTYKWAADSGSLMSLSVLYPVMNEEGMNVSVGFGVMNTEAKYKVDADVAGSRVATVETSNVVLGLSASTTMDLGGMALKLGVEGGFKVYEIDKASIEVSTLGESLGQNLTIVAASDTYATAKTYFTLATANDVDSAATESTDTNCTTNGDVALADGATIASDDKFGASDVEVSTNKVAVGTKWAATTAAAKDFEAEDIGMMYFGASIGMDMGEGMSVALSFTHVGGDDLDNEVASNGNVKITNSVNYIGASFEFCMS